MTRGAGAEAFGALLRVSREGDPRVAAERWLEGRAVGLEGRRALLDESQADWKFLLPPRALGRAATVGLGCGATVSLARSCRRLWALGMSPEESAYLRVRADHEGLDRLRPLCVAAGPVLPFRAGTLDLVVIAWAPWLHGLRGRTASRLRRSLLEEAVRVLGPGGSLLVLDTSPAGRLLRRAGRLWRRRPAADSVTTGAVWPLGRYRRLLPGLGFEALQAFALYPSARAFDWILPLDCPPAWLPVAGPAGRRWRRARPWLGAFRRLGMLGRLMPAYLIVARRS